MKNSPDAVIRDLTEAMQEGNTNTLFALSTQRVREMLLNEFALSWPNLSFDEAVEQYSSFLRNQYENGNFSAPILKEEEAGQTFRGTCVFLRNDDSPVTLTFRIIRDRHGNWKNDTRL